MFGKGREDFGAFQRIKHVWNEFFEVQKIKKKFFYLRYTSVLILNFYFWVFNLKHTHKFRFVFHENRTI